jgi:myosin-5
VKILFGNTGHITGAVIEKYLLEKTRIVHQIDGERNFHIFYQLIKGYQSSTHFANELASIGHYGRLFKYITEESLDNNKHIPDANEFNITCDCMSSVGIDIETQKMLYSILLGILHLGNLNFDENLSESCVGAIQRDCEEQYDIACQLLGIDKVALLTVITTRNMHVSGSTIVKSQTLAQACDKKDSFSKSIYSMVFSWLVERINTTLVSYTKNDPWGNKAI